MDRFFNSKRQNMTSYLDIFKACRLCGSGGGYKMPIIQKIDDNDTIDVEAELKQKIKECVSIEVHSDDRMPPLICELCVDKVNDFYEFREMCKATNSRVRSSLGLPPQLSYQDTTEDCILGVTGPVFHSSKEPEPTPLQRKPGPASRVRKSKNLVIQLAPESKRNIVSKSHPLLVERTRRRPTELECLTPTTKRIRFSTPSPSPSVISTRSDRKRSLEAKAKPVENRKLLKETVRELRRAKEPKVKDVVPKIKIKEVLPDPRKEREKRVPYPCDLCPSGFKVIKLFKEHQAMMHTPLVLTDRMGCAPCREWFLTQRDAEAHHKWHKTSNTFYQCSKCSADFKALLGYTKHLQLNQCIPETIVPDVTCPECLVPFATQTWMSYHKCPGPPPPPEVCSRCKKTFKKSISLKKHQKTCRVVSHVELNPNNPYLQALRAVEVRVPRCDNLVTNIKEEPGEIATFDIANVKIEPEEQTYDDALCDIKQEIKEEPTDYGYNDDYGGNYDSSNDSASDTEAPRVPNLVRNPFARKTVTQVESLSLISLRTIFSGKLLKKKTKSKKKKIKLEHMPIQNIKSEPQDSIFNNDDPEPETAEAVGAADTENERFTQDCIPVSEQDSIRDMNLLIGKSNLLEMDESHLRGDKENDDGAESLKVDGDVSKTNELNSHETMVAKNSAGTENINHLEGHENKKITDETEIGGMALENTKEDESGSPEESVVVNPGDACKKSTIKTDKLLDEENVLADLTDDETTKLDVRIGDLEAQAKENKKEGALEDINALAEKLLEEIEDTETSAISNNIDSAIIADSQQQAEPSIDDLSLSDDSEINTNHPISQHSTVHDDGDIDLDVDSVFRGELNPEVLKKRNIIITQPIKSQASSESADPMKPDLTIQETLVENNNDLNATSVVDDALDSSINMESGSFCEHSNSVSKSDKISVTNEQNDIGEESAECNIAKETVENDPEKEKKSENDIMDLISDSGDDCNIVDSPDKTKMLEDQLLYGDDDNTISGVSSKDVEAEESNDKKFEDSLLDDMEKTQENNSLSDPEQLLQKNCGESDKGIGGDESEQLLEKNAEDKLDESDPSYQQNNSVAGNISDGDQCPFKDMQLSEGRIKSKGECKELNDSPSATSTDDLDAVSDGEFNMDL